MSKKLVHFEIYGALDRAGGKVDGKVSINRLNNVVEVRPKGSRKAYTFVLDDMCTMAIQKWLRETTLKKVKKG